MKAAVLTETGLQIQDAQTQMTTNTHCGKIVCGFDGISANFLNVKFNFQSIWR
jgi:hypothetical protein